MTYVNASPNMSLSTPQHAIQGQIQSVSMSSVVHAASVIPCDPGSYNPQNTQTACTLCAAGTYNIETNLQWPMTFLMTWNYYTDDPWVWTGLMPNGVGSWRAKSETMYLYICYDWFRSEVLGSCFGWNEGNPIVTGKNKEYCWSCKPGSYIGSAGLGYPTTFNYTNQSVLNGKQKTYTFAGHVNEFPSFKSGSDSILALKDSANVTSWVVSNSAGIAYLLPNDQDQKLTRLMTLMTDIKYCVLAPAGTYVSGEGAGAPTACNGGAYSTGVGLTTNQCRNCSDGTYPKDQGSSSCTTCFAGQWSTSGMSSCASCPTGKSSGKGASICTNCSANQFSIPGGLCKECKSGQHSLPGGACTTTFIANAVFNRDFTEVCTNVAFYTDEICSYMRQSNPTVRLACTAHAINDIPCPDGKCPCVLQQRRLLTLIETSTLTARIESTSTLYPQISDQNPPGMMEFAFVSELIETTPPPSTADSAAIGAIAGGIVGCTAFIACVVVYIMWRYQYGCFALNTIPNQKFMDNVKIVDKRST